MALIEAATARALGPETERGAAELIAELGRQAIGLYTIGFRSLGLKARHVRTLRALRNGPLSQQALGEAVGVDGTQLVGFLNELELEQLVLRRRDPEDRRRHIVELSQRGRTRLDAADNVVAEVDARFVSVLPPEQRAEFVAQLRVIARELAAGDASLTCDVESSPDPCSE